MFNQIWLIRNDAADSFSALASAEHLQQTIRNSRSRVQGLQIAETVYPNRIEFALTGTVDGQPYAETIVAHTIPVWDEPTHL